MRFATPNPSASAPMTAIVRVAIFAVTIALFLGSTLNMFLGNRDIAVLMALATPLGISAWGFAHAGHNEHAMVLLSCVLITVVTLILIRNPLGVHDVAITAYSGIILAGALLLSRRSFVAIAALAMLAAVGAFVLDMHGFTQSRIADHTGWGQLVNFLIITAVFATIGRVAAEQLFWSLGSAQLASVADPVTGLVNRPGFLMHGAERLAAEKGKPGCAVLVLLDLDGFRRVNLVIGHRAGDRVLHEAAQRIAALSGSHLAARIGDDEFAVLAVRLADDAAAAAFSSGLHAALNFEFSGVSVRNAAGYARFPRDANSIEALLLAAESSLLSAKRHETERFAGPADRI
jgi:diguanylate cyclase (GGDEF)-like protein